MVMNLTNLIDFRNIAKLIKKLTLSLAHSLSRSLSLSLHLPGHHRQLLRTKILTRGSTKSLEIYKHFSIKSCRPVWFLRCSDSTLTLYSLLKQPFFLLSSHQFEFLHTHKLASFRYGEKFVLGDLCVTRLLFRFRSSIITRVVNRIIRETKMGSLAPVMEKQQSLRGKSMEEEQQQSLRCVGAENQVRKVRALEKQVSFQSGNVEKHGVEVRAMEKQEWEMERQRSIRGFVEKQKSFRLVMERQISFINGGGGERTKKRNESPGKRGDSPLHIAVRTGNLGKVMESIRGCNGIEELKELLSKQNLEGETPLYTAAENGDSLVVEEMLKHMDLDTASIAARNGFDPFHVAAKQGHLGRRNLFYCTPSCAMNLECVVSFAEALKKLLETFPNLAMTTDLSCTTALHTAATQGHIDVVNLLLKTDSHLAKIAKNNGKTALHSAARMGHVEVVKSLIGNDARIGSRTDKKGQTALHMAVKGQNEGIVLELVKPDPAVLSVEDNKGNAPLHIASKKGRTKVSSSLDFLPRVSQSTRILTNCFFAFTCR